MGEWKLDKLSARNFRNLTPTVFEFVPGINCIFGNNGNGKTNLLEAVYLLTNRRSFRKNTTFPQMINIEGGSPEFTIQSTFISAGERLSYSLRACDQLEERFTNSQPSKTKTPATSVFINPFDSYAFHNSSTYRRQWLDAHLALMDREYKQVHTRFTKSMKFRNSILYTGGKSAPAQLRAIDEQIAEYSELITSRRVDFLRQLNEFITPTFSSIFAEEHTLQTELDSVFVHWDKKRIFDFYRHQELSDLKAQVTQVGIHRDDLLFMFDGLNAFEFCSLGQQKMGFLSLIFAYIELFRYKFSSYPIVLIDDVSGELDGQRWKNLIHYLGTKNFQVLITTANENFGKELEQIPNSKKYYLEHGQLKRPD